MDKYFVYCRILQILRNSENLYSLTSNAHGEFGTESTQPSEREIFQNQFLTVYGGKAASVQVPSTRHSSMPFDDVHRGEDWKQPRLSGIELGVS